LTERCILTVGAYGFTPEGFFSALEQAGADLFLDVRQRRGLRGSQYAFANATRLTSELENRGIAYCYERDLAPDSDIRQVQHEADAAAGVTKVRRRELAPLFIETYTARKLEPFDWRRLTTEIANRQAPVVFCVERNPESCHRSLVAARLARLMNRTVLNLTP
jgi:uncharacterized protein (DUF488 family)